MNKSIQKLFFNLVRINNSRIYQYISHKNNINNKRFLPKQILLKSKLLAKFFHVNHKF